MYPNRRRQWIRGILVFFVAGLALMVATLVIEQIGKPSGAPEPKTGPPTYPAAPASPTSSAPSASRNTPAPSSAQSTPSAPVSGPLQLVRGSQQINGVQLGWPHTTVGAVSAADAWVVEIGSTLDPNRAASVARLAADPSATDAPEQAAQGAAGDRKDLGLPATGPVPAGTSIAIQPVEYQLRDASANGVLVLLLCDTATTRPSGTQSSYGVFPVQVGWRGNDWLIVPSGGSTYDNLAAEPDSPQAAALGWQDLQPPEG